MLEGYRSLFVGFSYRIHCQFPDIYVSKTPNNFLGRICVFNVTCGVVCALWHNIFFFFFSFEFYIFKFVFNYYYFRDIIIFLALYHLASSNQMNLISED